MDKRIFIRIVAALTLFATVDSASAQRVPNDEDIVSKVISSDSPFYYQPMMIRYMAGDLELTPEHYYYLYYGFAYDDAYDAHATLPGEDAILEIFARTKNLSKEDAEAIIDAAKENMLVDPFSPSNINMMTYAYNVLGDTINEIISADRFRKVIGAIESSGLGTKEISPWHILRFSHANDLINAKGYKIENRQVRSNSVEYIRVNRNPDNVNGYFFDYSRVYWKPYEGERIKRKSNWELNGIPL